MEASDLAEIEEIKQLKARYLRLMDTKQWPAWAELLTESCVLEYGPDLRVEGREAIVEFVRGALNDATSVHLGYMPEIELTGPAAARGIWAMSDVVEWTDERRANSLRGFGHYEDEYVKEDGRWRINRLLITRLRVDPFEPSSARRGGMDASPEKKKA